MTRSVLEDHGQANGPTETREELLRQYLERRGIDTSHASAHAADLALVVAVLQGEARAVREFDRLLVEACRVAARIDSAAAFLDDVRQELRLGLLAGPSPKLDQYAAAGSLTQWLRVAALRTALNLKRSDHLLPVEELPAAAAWESLGERAQLGRVYLPELKQAVELSFRGLPLRERTLLRLHFIDGFALDRIGVMYGVHRATVARWLAATRQRIFDDVVQRMALTRGLSPSEVRSIYRELQQSVDIAVSQVLKTEQVPTGQLEGERSE
jgi:RNA polymerase sigma-70 factor, ECF subfamily